MNPDEPDFRSIGNQPINFGEQAPDLVRRTPAPDYASYGELPTGAYDGLEETSPELASEQKAVALKPGDLIANRFKVIGQLGFGGMGPVYRVADEHMNEERALKVMLPSLLNSTKAKSRFLEEIKISQKLSDDRIVRVYDLVDNNEHGLQCVTMELVQGTTLGRKMNDSGGTLPVDQALDIMRQLCDALGYAHQYTIHRDLKPKNIMFQSNGEIRGNVLCYGESEIGELPVTSSYEYARRCEGNLYPPVIYYLQYETNAPLARSRIIRFNSQLKNNPLLLRNLTNAT